MTILFLFAEDVFKYGCRLSNISPGLEIRLVHDLLHLSSGDQVPHSSTLLMRCQDQTAAMAGAATTQCQDGRWSNNLPICRSTPGPEDYSGDIWNFKLFQLSSHFVFQIPFHHVYNSPCRAVLGALDVLASWLLGLEQLFTWTALQTEKEEILAGDGLICTRSTLQVNRKWIKMSVVKLYFIKYYNSE